MGKAKWIDTYYTTGRYNAMSLRHSPDDVFPWEIGVYDLERGEFSKEMTKKFKTKDEAINYRITVNLRAMK